MRLNNRGDALTLALGAAAFIGFAILVMSSVMMNMRSKGVRARVMNEAESVVMSVNHLVANRDLCVTAFRSNLPGFPVVRIFPPPPNGTTFTATIDRVYLGSGATERLQVCAEPNLAVSPPECAAIRNPIIYTRGIQFTMLNNAANNRIFTWKGNSVGRYRQLSGQIRIGSGIWSGRVPLGGVLQPRQFPIQMIIDTTPPVGAPGLIELCYSGESPVQLCAQMGGTVDPGTGVCAGILGICVPDPAVVCTLPTPWPAAPTACPGPDLAWIDHYYALGLDKNLKVLCACNKICSESP